ncbi:hypothetical protein OCU04_008026 [Sclerotinia nivalis]|uniref:Uncharacterized protein n=1 Tax=Sclerotinia nivalis TaxID=352851 RepID=A0A9X0AIC6_9HELO|nr:hypothetical protein OCU04_008026 [Sclerotinia nivalis]
MCQLQSSGGVSSLENITCSLLPKALPFDQQLLTTGLAEVANKWVADVALQHLYKRAHQLPTFTSAANEVLSTTNLTDINLCLDQINELKDNADRDTGISLSVSLFDNINMLTTYINKVADAPNQPL